MQHPPESHKSRSLVRFRAMVQDTSLSPEMYLSSLRGGRAGGWGVTEDSETLNYSDLRECTVLWAVSIPSDSTWVLSESPQSKDALLICTR